MLQMEPQLLSRDEFRTKVFERDHGKCVVCPADAVDAHHILDRSLWDNGGYYLSNGVSLCSVHHLDAEKTHISCETLREQAGIIYTIQPDHFYADEKYDHWGNILLPNGTRLKGELFGNENVQKILKEAGVLSEFSSLVKYPRTYHCPWSQNLQNDDRRHEDISFLLNKRLVVTLKMDGENTTMYNYNIHARSLSSGHHPSRSFVKSLHGQIAHDIPGGFRICGENLYAKHSIHYEHLKSYFLVFSIWNDNNIALSWDETKEYSALLGLETVPELCSGVYKTVEELKESVEAAFKKYQEQSKDEVEGYVIRLADRIHYKDFRKAVAKSVRKNHVQTSEFWMNQPIIPNKIES